MRFTSCVSGWAKGGRKGEVLTLHFFPACGTKVYRIGVGHNVQHCHRFVFLFPSPTSSQVAPANFRGVTGTSFILTKRVCKCAIEWTRKDGIGKLMDAPTTVSCSF